MTRLASIAIAVLMAAALAAQDRSGVIEGTVRREDTGDPIVGVFISIDEDGAPSPREMDAVTDVAGHFIVRNVRPGLVSIRARRDGYLAPSAGAAWRGTLEPGGSAAFNLSMTLSRVLNGRLLDPDGKPARGLTVRAIRVPDNGGQPFVAKETYTNDRGEYRLWGLGPGKYYVLGEYSSKNGDVPVPPGFARDSWQATYYPGAIEPGRGEMLDLSGTPAAEGLDFRILKSVTYRISGSVTHPSLDLSEERPTIVLIPKSVTDASDPGIRHIQNERFQGIDIRGVPSGGYVLLAVVTRWAPDAGYTQQGVAAGQVEVNVTNDLEGVTVPLGSSGIDVRGNVVADDGLPWNSRERSLTIHLRAAGGDTTSLPFLLDAGGFLRSYTVNGAFQFGNVPPGTYFVEVSNLSEGEAVGEIRAGSTHIGADGLKLTGKATEALRIVIKKAVQ